MTTSTLLEMTARQNRSLFVRLTTDVRNAMERRAVRRQLLKFDDHLLRDIGLTRQSRLFDEF